MIARKARKNAVLRKGNAFMTDYGLSDDGAALSSLKVD